MPVYSLPYLWSHVLLCLGGWVHWCPCCVHRSLVVRDMSPCCPAHCPLFLFYGMTPTDCCLLLSFVLVVRGYVVYWWVRPVSGGYSGADVPQSHPGAGLPASRHGEWKEKEICHGCVMAATSWKWVTAMNKHTYSEVQSGSLLTL